jgi:cytochrome b pre-mRNA-processing protein 3
MLGLFTIKRQDYQKIATILYDKAIAQTRHPYFYTDLMVEDNLDGRFDLLTLHIFLLLYQLGKEKKTNKKLSQSLFDIMFFEMDRALRELGVSDMAIGKRIKAMGEAFYGRVAAYEGALRGEDDLKAALVRNLYRGREIPHEILIKMENYIRISEHSLATLLQSELTTDHIKNIDCYARLEIL